MLHIDADVIHTVLYKMFPQRATFSKDTIYFQTQNTFRVLNSPNVSLRFSQNVLTSLFYIIMVMQNIGNLLLYFNYLYFIHCTTLYVGLYTMLLLYYIHDIRNICRGLHIVSSRHVICDKV